MAGRYALCGNQSGRVRLMKILVALPIMRNLNGVLRRVFQMQRGEHRVDFMAYPDDEPLLAKVNKARETVLGAWYDGLMCVEDDILVPADALVHLCEILAEGAGVAYGLNVWRKPPHKWSACQELSENHDLSVSDVGLCETLWGNKYESVGCGMFCILIGRDALGLVPFRKMGEFPPDRPFAIDCRAHGIKQVTDGRVVCGHTDGEHTYWPAPGGMRKERFDAGPVVSE